MALSPKTVCMIGAYAFFPALAAGGGFLLSRTASVLGLTCAAVMIAAALALPAVLGAHCRRCGDGLWNGLARLLVLPIVLIALFFRSGRSAEQGAGLGLLGLGVLSFVAAWRLTGRANATREE